MSDQDKSISDDYNDDTSYEAWLKEHALPVVASPVLDTEKFDENPSPRRDLGSDEALRREPARSPGWAKLLVVLVPLLFLACYYTYSSVSGATFFGKTLSNNVNLENGLVGHWTFDGPDMSTTTVSDVSGNGNIGSLTGTRIPKPTLGKVGQGIILSGIPGLGQVSVTSVTSIENLPTLTLGAWVRSATPNQSQHILSKGNGSSDPDNGWIFRINSFGGLEFRVAYNTTDLIRTSASALLKTNKWHYVNVVWDGSTSASNVKIYVDGAEVAYTTTTNGSTSRVADDSGLNKEIRIGNSSGGSAIFNGSLDDVRIYNRILSAKEVEALYRLGEGSKINVTQTPDNLQTGLVGHWTFDGPDLTTATATDKSESGNHGTLVNGPKPAIGKVGQGLSFNISSTNEGKKVNLGSPSVIDNLSNRSVSLWIKFAPGGPSTQHLINKSQWRIYKSIGSRIYFYQEFSGDSGVWYSDIVSAGKWTHVVVSYSDSSSANDPVIYINGTVATTIEQIPPVGTVSDDANSTVYMGGDSNTPGTQNLLGTLDDVRVYNRILSADEVAQLYSLGSGSTIKICKEASVQDADGGTYNTIAIGSQCWLDRNMNVGTRINVSTNQTNNSTIEKWCYNDDVGSTCSTNNPNKPDGGLYQWNEAMQYSTTEGARGICPVGFHIPTNAQWHTLEKFLVDGGAACGATMTGFRCDPAGTKLQPGGRSGFEFNLAGLGFSGLSLSRTSSGNLWSSSDSGGGFVWVRGVNSSSVSVLRGTSDKTVGYPVRCLQD